MNFIRQRSASLSTVVFMLFIIALLQGSISYTISYGKLESIVSWLEHGFWPTLGIVIRGALYEDWVPHYTDYIYLAFTTSFAFSSTDALQLTRRAKMLMSLKSTISIITLTAIASSTINIMVGGY